MTGITRRRLVLLWLGALAASATAAGPAAAVEPWADPKLPVTAGLELWLDAARANGDKPAPRDGKLVVWSDASGKGRHARQSSADARPARLPAGGSAVVRFDGLDDHLRAVTPAAEADAFTVFVVASPRQNLGGFRGLLAFNAAGGRDYETGLTIDLGPAPTPRFTALNVEGRGFGTWRNLLTKDRPFGGLHTLEVTADAKAVRLSVDGEPAGGRPRDGRPVAVGEVTVGARYYTHAPGPQQVQGFARCDVAEVLVYGRALSADEAKRVRAYLDAKHAALRQQLPPDGGDRGTALVPVADPPPVQVLVPGFTVRELPVDLTNVNNVRYRPDGTLVALGYNGVVWHLRDTDGDGREDAAAVFWDSKGALQSPIGMAVAPPGCPHGDGVFVTSPGKCVLIADTDRDGKGDKEIVVAGGWSDRSVNIDVIGVAVDPKDGSVYFGRGTPNFANGYLLDKAGKAGYSLADERGTIQRVSPDFKTRQVVATGIRFPVGMQFNRHGDLFCTDQEGATWLPNGNPFDELLHVQTGRHYGFPPRHPKHLPGVIDEPSTFDYGPQHQSTCGFCFNEPVKPGGPVFGPAAWAGDAIVTGESRGKLYRTQLVKSAAGYVARTQLLACLGMLTVDCCVAPDGSLVVACHSGGPDWGSGPSGKGKLFKITSADPDRPQPAFAWPSGPREVRVEFDRPVDPELLRDALKQTKLAAGKSARAGDRFESIWPGYAVVQAQKAEPRYDVPVRSAQLTPDRRTLVLATDPHPAAVHYALTLPGLGRPPADKMPTGTLRQVPETDLDFDLSGCEATWVPAGGEPAWTGWLPHPDLQVARAMTAGSAPHDALWAAMARPGELALRFKLDLADVLRPAVQPGSKLDFESPPEDVTVAFESAAPLTLTLPDGKLGGTPGVSFGVRPKPNAPVPVELRLASPGGSVPLTVRFRTSEDKRPRPIPLRRVLLPWADTDARALDKETVVARLPELEGGSWARGRKVFFGEQAGCARCHAVHGKGGDIGPDLSNLVHRDYASVLRDITQPSFALNPDHLTYVVQTADGRTLTGVVRTAGDKLRVGDLKGTVTEVAKADVERMTASPVSTMPEGLPKDLGPDRIRDLLTFLLTPAPSMPQDYPGKRPAPRTRAELAAVLAGAPEPPAKARPIRVVLVAGPKDHGPGEHDYPAWQKAWAELLAAADGVEVATAWEWPAADEFRRADVMVFYQHGDWDARRAADIDAFLERGGGLAYVHWAVDGRKGGRDFARRIGLAAGGAVGFRHGDLPLTFNREVKHPVTRNFDTLKLVDESYWKMAGDLPAERVLAWATEEGSPRPQVWSVERGRGRVFVSIPGHYSWTFDDPLFRVLLLRGIAWAANEPVGRFNDLATPGARLTD